MENFISKNKLKHTDSHISIDQTSKILNKSGREFQTFFKHGSLEVEIYKPDKLDKQSPHDRDEVYIIISGHGFFQHKANYYKIKPGDFLFVPASDPHFFFDFSEDFSTWVLFYGPNGGEDGIIENLLEE